VAITRRTLRLTHDMRDAIDRIVDARTRALVSAWAAAWDEIAPDLTQLLVDMLTSGDKITRTQLLRSTRLRGALVVIAEHLRRLGMEAGVSIVGDLDDLIEAAGGAQASIIDSQLPPGFMDADALASWSRVDPEQVAAIIDRSTGQILAKTRPVAADTYDAIRRELMRGIAAGPGPRDTAYRMVRRVENRFNFGLTRALVVARTEMPDAHRHAAMLGRQAHADVLTGWTWVCALDTRTCESCLAQNGSVHPISEPGPFDHHQGRCVGVPTTKSWRDLGIDIPEPESVLPDARAWFDDLPAERQLQIMGPARLELLQSGQIGWDDLSTRRTTPEWRDSWHPTPLRDLRRIAAQRGGRASPSAA